VGLQVAEHGTKFRRDLQIAINGVTQTSLKFSQKRILRILWQNFAQHVLIHQCTFCEIFIKIWDGWAGSICWFDTKWPWA